MPITVNEKPESRRYTEDDSATLVYDILGSAVTAEITAALKTEAPATFENLNRKNVSLDPVFVDASNPDSCIWRGEVSYIVSDNDWPTPKKLEVGESSYSFDTTGGTQHITQSIATVASYCDGGDVWAGSPPDYKRAIGYDGQSVQGVDITVPQFSFNETHCLSDATVTTTYKQTVADLTGKVNSVSFKGFDAGEVLFLGASGSKRGDGDWEITYNFAVSKNKTTMFTVGNIPVNGGKKGWDYLWVLYADQKDTTAKSVVKRPAAVYIEQVYETASFAGLGI